MSLVSTNLTEEELKNADNLFEFAERLKFGELHIKFDIETGLKAIVALHSTTLGPALGGCRCIEYSSSAEAIVDAMRLARGMSYKAAIAGLPHGGGKAVIIKPPQIKDREAYFKAFGRFVNDLGGRYITAKDSGTTVNDMDVIATQTQYVTSNTPKDGSDGDPSPATARGVLRGIQAAVKHKLGRDDLENLHIAIQGVGYVGYYLAKDLHAQGAKLTVCDINPENTKRCVEEFNAKVVSVDDIYSVNCDVFAPCALGAILNDVTIPQIKAPIIAGAANNQLSDRHHGEILQQKNILYAPDYVINAGGLIFAAAQYANETPDDLEKDLSYIHEILLDIFARADQEERATNFVASTIAKELMQKKLEQ